MVTSANIFIFIPGEQSMSFIYMVISKDDGQDPYGNPAKIECELNRVSDSL